MARRENKCNQGKPQNMHLSDRYLFPTVFPASEHYLQIENHDVIDEKL